MFHFCLTKDSSCSADLGLLCLTRGQMFSICERFVLQAGQFSTQTLLNTKPCSCNRCNNALILTEDAVVRAATVGTAQFLYQTQCLNMETMETSLHQLAECKKLDFICIAHFMYKTIQSALQK